MSCLLTVKALHESLTAIAFANDCDGIDGLLVKAIERVEQLEKRSDFLSALEAAGVDSWDGYENVEESFNV